MWIRVKAACHCEMCSQLWNVSPFWQFMKHNNKHFQKHHYFLKFCIPISFCFVFQNFFDRKWIRRLDFDFCSGAPTSIPSSEFQNSNPSQGWSFLILKTFLLPQVCSSNPPMVCDVVIFTLNLSFFSSLHLKFIVARVLGTNFYLRCILNMVLTLSFFKVFSAQQP
jgi:hypothetical protein